jgi:predicted ATPase/DNA-binding SARP family transcriptional activator
MSPHLALYLLGPPKLEIDGSPVTADRRKTLALLAYLALNREQYTREYLSALLWPDYDQEKAFTNLRHTLWETQQAIGEGWIIANRETIALNTDSSIWLDVAHFETLLTQSRAQADVSLRISLLTDSAKIYRNHFLTGFSLKDAPTFNEWAFARSEELRHQLARALTALSDDLCSLGQAETAIPHAQRLITLDPLNEASHRQLMQVYLQAGQHNAALKQYQTCEKILRKEMGLDPQPETRELYKKIRKGEIKSSQPFAEKGTSAPQHNLPFQLSKFIGREKELGEIKSLIADHHLVTLLGTGGIGKTRLSLRSGELLLNEYTDGVWFVELASLNDSTLIPHTVAKLFNLVEQSEESVTEKLVRVLRPKTILLILDNCEHLIEACAQLADVLLKNCPNLKIIATSREPLGITGEAQYHVPPLGLPDLQQLLEQLLGYESIQLFEERARLVQENFSLTPINASPIAHICHRLDGIPLAIELAAARVNLLSPEQIALKLDESFSLLTGGSRTAMPRHQTLRASIDWSWNLLSAPERTLLRRLSIFAGGWTFDAAESVCSGNGLEPGQVLEVMKQLAAKSLIVVNQDEGRERRYRLLEMVRQYAREQLVDTGEEKNIQNQYLKYFLGFSEQIEYGLMGPRQVELMSRTIDERDNLRAVLEYSAITDDVEAGLLLSGRLRNFWESFDMREGGRWLAEFLQKPESKEYPVARAKALCAYGWILEAFQQFDEARFTGEESLAICRAHKDQYGEVDSLNLLGGLSEDGEKKAEYCQQALALARSLGDVMRQTTSLQMLGWDHRDYKRAFAYWEEAVILYRQIGGWRYLANVLSLLGLFTVMDGDSESAQKYLDEADLLYEKMNTKAGKNNLLIAYGQIALLRGDYERARYYFQENAKIRNESGNLIDDLWSKARIGHMEIRAGNITEARQIFSEIIPIFHKGGDKMGIVYNLEGMSSLDVAVHKHEHAAYLIGWTDGMRAEIGNTRPFLEQVDVDRDIAAVVSKIGKTKYEEAYNKGYAMTIDEAVEYALDGSNSSMTTIQEYDSDN